MIGFRIKVRNRKDKIRVKKIFINIGMCVYRWGYVKLVKIN